MDFGFPRMSPSVMTSRPLRPSTVSDQAAVSSCTPASGWAPPEAAMKATASPMIAGLMGICLFFMGLPGGSGELYVIFQLADGLSLYILTNTDSLMLMRNEPPGGLEAF